MSQQTTVLAVHAHGNVHAHGFRPTRALMEVDLPRVMRQHPDVVHDANAIYHVTITPAGTWTVDSTVPNGKVYVGLRGHSDCDVELSEDTMHHLMDGSETAKGAYLRGELHVTNIPAAMRFAAIISALASLRR